MSLFYKYLYLFISEIETDLLKAYDLNTALFLTDIKAGGFPMGNLRNDQALRVILQEFFTHCHKLNLDQLRQLFSKLHEENQGLPSLAKAKNVLDKAKDSEPFPLPESNLNEIELISDLEIDSNQLRNLLSAGQPKAANQEQYSQLNRLFNELDNDQEEIRACRNASQWVADRATDWADEAKDAVIAEFPELRHSQDKVDLLYQDICNYLKWLGRLLYVGHGNVPLDKFVSFSSEHKFYHYRIAFNYLKEKKDTKMLSPKEAYYLECYLDYLISRL